MAHYRKITVNDETYQYVIGREYVKVKGVGQAKKEDVGELVREYNEYDEEYEAVEVTPKHIKEFIERNI